MNQEEAVRVIHERGAEYFQRDKSGKGYICPICKKSGTGKKGTGITTKDGIHYTCWAGCFTNLDFIDIIGLERNLTSFKDKLDAACSILGIILDGDQNKGASNSMSIHNSKSNSMSMSIHNSIHNNIHIKESGADPAPEEDRTSFFLEANKHLQETTYHRGISLETLNRYKVGYIENWRHPDIKTAPASPRLIVPTSKESYLARDTRSEIPENQKKYEKIKVGAVRIYNWKTIEKASKPIFVVEGELDALSIIDVGGEAVALGGLPNTGKFLDLLKEKKGSVNTAFIIALDNEETDAVKNAEEKLGAGLDKLGLIHYECNPYGDCKDANEALNKDREKLAAEVKEIEERAGELYEDSLSLEKDLARMELEGESAGRSIQELKDRIQRSKDTPYIKTGFPSLDKILDGGLFEGLYFIGAISSLGKTTFALQMADYIAQQGKRVLIFSLEMARTELMAKSVSRLTYTESRSFNRAKAKSTRDILAGQRYKYYSEDERELITHSIQEYSKYANNIWISEGVGDIGTEEIRAKIEQFKNVYGEPPVVIIDYLQIIAPESDRNTDKQNTDLAVVNLKRISRDFLIPIIGISSFNRDNYTAPVNLTSFKETGSIEYSSEVLIGLQYEGMDYEDGEKKEAREKRIRDLLKKNEDIGRGGEQAQKVQVKILKHRNGSKGSFVLDFYPMYNYFEEPNLLKEDEEKEAQTTDPFSGWEVEDYSQEELPF